MNTVSIIKDVIKNHPLIEFDNGPGIITERWACCPCGYTSPRYKTAASAAKAFEGHIAEEVNEELLQMGALRLRTASSPNGGVPTKPLNVMQTFNGKALKL